MINAKRDYLKIGILLSLASAVISLSFADPINWPKQIALVTCLPFTLLLAFRNIPQGIAFARLPSVLILLFIISGTLSAFLTNSNLVRTFWGTFGRNNGLFTYIAFACLIASGLMISMSGLSYLSLFTPFIFMIVISAIYGFLQAQNIDPIEWSQAGQAFAFFGNINFASALFGLGTILTLSLATLRQRNRKEATALFFTSLILASATWISDSLQGVLVILVFTSLLIFFLLEKVNKWVSRVFLFMFTLVSGFIGLGFLGLGPLGRNLYQYTLELRFNYIYTGIKMGLNHPITGVGIDSYGDWYRNFRSLDLIGTTGVDLTVNNAHSGPIQIFSTLGLIPFLTILALYFLAFRNAVSKIFGSDSALDQKLFAAVFLVVSLNSFLSIDNISIGIWNYLLLGLNLSTSKKTNKQGSGTSRMSRNSSAAKPNQVGKLIALVSTGLLFTLSWGSSFPDRRVVSIYQSANSPAPDNSNIQKIIQLQELANSPFMGEAHFRLVAEALSSLGQNEGAISVLKIGINRFPRDYQLHDYLAVFLERANRKEEAVRVRETQVKLDPNHPQVWLFLALDLSELGRKSDAESAFAKTLELREFLNQDIQARLSEYEKLILG